MRYLENAVRSSYPLRMNVVARVAVAVGAVSFFGGCAQQIELVPVVADAPKYASGRGALGEPTISSRRTLRAKAAAGVVINILREVEPVPAQRLLKRIAPWLLAELVPRRA